MKSIATMHIKSVKETELKVCPLCRSTLETIVIAKKGVKLHGFKCKKCHEIVFPSSEVFRYEVLTGKRNVREVRKVGNSVVIGVPSRLAHDIGIKPGDLVYFEKKDHEFTINILKK